MIKNITVVGTFRKDNPGLKETYYNLKDLGFNIMSPGSPKAELIEEKFTFMKGETIYTKDRLEMDHLLNIVKSDCVWLFAPNGYVGYTAAAEIFYTLSLGKKIYTDQPDIPGFLKYGAVGVVNKKELVGKEIESGLTYPTVFSKAIELALDRQIEHYDLVQDMVCAIKPTIF